MAQAVQEIIDFYESLLDEYPAPESWASNIQKAVRRLPTEIAMSNFYSYLFNPTDYVYREHIACLTKEDEAQFEKNAKAFDEQNELEMVTYENLNDAKVFYQPKKVKGITHDAIEKPMAGLLESLPIQTQGSIHEGMHEAGSSRMEEEKTKEKVSR